VSIPVKSLMRSILHVLGLIASPIPGICNPPFGPVFARLKMAEQRMQMVSLESVITDYIDQSEQSIHKYTKLWHIGFRGMQQLGLDFFYSVKTVKLPVSDTFTVQFPSDLVQYNKIGLLNSGGEVVPLKFNPKLTNYADLFPDRIADATDPQLNFFAYNNLPTNGIFYNYFYDGYMSNMYGVPSGGYGLGQFNVDEANGLVILNPNFPYTYLIIEYISAPEEGGNYMLPIQFREALIAFLAWQDIAFLPSTRKGSISDKQERKTNYYNERRLAIARFKPYRFDVAYNINLDSSRMTVKV